MNRSRSFENFLAILTLLLVFIITTHTPADADMWWHLRAGQAMAEAGRILTTDIFSYTRYGAPWINAFWLADLLLYGIYCLGGFAALSAFAAALGALTFGMLYLNGTSRGILKSGIMVLAAIAASPFWAPRPQLLSFLFLAILDKWLVDYRNEKASWPWLLPLFFALWANVHGGFVWGLLLLLAHLTGELLEGLLYGNRPPPRPLVRLAAWSLVSVAATGLNPNGLGILGLPFLQLQVSLQIQEWNSPDFHQAALQPTLLLLLIFIGTGLSTNKRMPLADVLKMAGFAALALFAQRNIAPFILVLTPLLLDRIQAAREAWLASSAAAIILNRAAQQGSTELPPALRGTINSILILALAFLALVRVAIQAQQDKVDATFPAQAVQWLKANKPEGRLFNSYNWGGYLLWELPEYPVFIDGRADLYGRGLIEQWHAVVRADESAASILDRWQVHTVLLEPGWPIVPELVRRGWKIAYQDKISVILIAPDQ